MKFMLGAKIHRATITECDLNYEGSCAIDTKLLKAADIDEFEKIHIYNISNGQRFETYAIAAPEGSGVIGLNGAAARLGHKGDLVIIVTYKLIDEGNILKYKPKIVFVDEKNQIKK